jgi:hypothetical protein
MQEVEFGCCLILAGGEATPPAGRDLRAMLGCWPEPTHPKVMGIHSVNFPACSSYAIHPTTRT